ncbi:ABC transporter ATP-binding protein [Actinomadura atramentaria]|uniref:ABC transporter ATP-binding protein n=1 Tax=Actinomadura atramentaria TaxID=1990 RepID=UPI000375650C|nr:ABC transporter ATP-binding protein [Actinomadura atramentaria]
MAWLRQNAASSVAYVGGPAVRAQALAKRYPGATAVRGVDLAVAPGETFGFLGPNGAGKTTTIGMLCTLTAPTSGDAWIDGHSVRTAPDRVRRSIGLVFQETTLDLGLTAWENLRFHARLYGVRADDARERARDLLDLAGLADRRDDPVAAFSGGMRRRLEIVRALMHRPRVLFLDEPTVGLDPQTRARIWEHLHRLRRREGITLFLTTHYLDEAEHCDRVAIIDGGAIVAEGTPAELKDVVGADRVELRTGDDAAAAERLRGAFGLEPALGPAGLSVRVADGASFVPRLCAGLDVPIDAVTVVRPSLDDVFLHYTGRTIRDEGAAR